MMAKLIITINLDNKNRPDKNEIADLRMNNELEYWIDYLRPDTSDMWRGATWEIVEECGEMRKHRKGYPDLGPCDLPAGHSGMHRDVDKYGRSTYWIGLNR